ncbi:SGNH/GDSL hydrolase family protein [Actinoplanes sp. NPDC049681]|uniref:SGNH/GDSL hydrolase family protein n=1 Tax=Actinoplanes sp. NPDC049681 TaxID=3363905 RepID=UPI0037BDBA53
MAPSSKRVRYLLAVVVAAATILAGVALAAPASAANVDTMTMPGTGTLTVEVTTTPAGDYDPRWIMFTSGSDDSLYLCDTGYCAAQTYTTPVRNAGSVFDFTLGENDGAVQLSGDSYFALQRPSGTTWVFTRAANPSHFTYTVKLTFTAGETTPTPSTNPTPTATPTPTPTPGETPTGPAPRTYVALGDSFASGEGAEESEFGGTTYPDPKVPGSTTGCHRSSTSWAHDVAAKLVGPTVDSWDFVACSGAVVDNLYGLNKTYSAVTGTAEPAQLSYVDRHTYRATLSIGGNDGNYAKIIRACVIDVANNQSDHGCRHKGSAGYRLAQEGMDRFRTGIPVPSLGAGATKQLAQVYFDVANKMAAGGQLVVASYPRMFATSRLGYRTFGVNCKVGTGLGGVGVYISYADAQWLNDLADAADAYIRSSIRDANAALKRARSTVTIDYADSSAQFTDHRLCSGSRWFNGAELTFTVPPRAKQVSFHPNAQGQDAYARAVLAKIRP